MCIDINTFISVESTSPSHVTHEAVKMEQPNGGRCERFLPVKCRVLVRFATNNSIKKMWQYSSTNNMTNSGYNDGSTISPIVIHSHHWAQPLGWETHTVSGSSPRRGQKGYPLHRSPLPPFTQPHFRKGHEYLGARGFVPEFRWMLFLLANLIDTLRQSNMGCWKVLHW